MNDIDWERAAATVGLCIVVSIATYMVCYFIGIPDPYRLALDNALCIGTAIAFYGSRKKKTRNGVPVE